jgi:hypothetical protein
MVEPTTFRFYISEAAFRSYQLWANSGHTIGRKVSAPMIGFNLLRRRPQ